MVISGRQFGEEEPFGPPGDLPEPSERAKRIINAGRPDESSFLHPQDAEKATKQWEARVSKYGDDPDAMAASNTRSGLYREEKRVREEIDLEQSWPYMTAGEQAEHIRGPGGEKLTGKFAGRRAEARQQSEEYAPSGGAPVEHHRLRHAFGYGAAAIAMGSALLPRGDGPRYTHVRRVV